MMSYHRYCGQNNFLRNRGGWIQQPWFTKTTPVQFCWKRTAGDQAQSGPNTCTPDISMSRYKSKRRQFMSPTARQKKWSPTSLRNPYRVLFSLRYVIISWEMKNLLTRLFPGVLSNHNLANIRKQKYISTRKHNSEAVGGMKQEHKIKDSDGSRSGHFSENIQGTTLQATGADNKSTEQSDAEVEQCGDRNGIVEPQSYQNVLVNG